MKLECFPMTENPPEMAPGRPQRAWMEAFPSRHPYRCLPLTMANTTGWELLCPAGFTVSWNGGPEASDITITPDRPNEHVSHFVSSHFTHGVVTFHVGYLFRTPPGWSLWTGGPPNHAKDGIQPLVGLVETDWLPYPFTMNWLFTRPGEVHFNKHEPFCFIMPMQDKPLETFDVVQRPLEADPDLKAQHHAWLERRADFNTRLAAGEPAARKEAWQRFYFKGELPDNTGEAPKDHVNKRRLKSKKLG